MDQDQPSLEESPAPAEAAGESQLNEQGDEAPPRRNRAILAALMIAVVGLLCVGGGIYWKYASTNEVFDMMARWGLNPHYAYAIGAIFLVLAVFTSVVGRRNARIDELETQLSIAEERWTGSDSVGERVGPAIETLGTTVEAMRSHVENLVGVLGGVESKVRTSERQNITIAASVDSLTAKVEKFQKDLGSTRNVPAVADELAPLVRLLDSLGRDQHSRATRQLEAIEEVQDTLAAMEGRMRERMESMQSGKQSGEEVIAKITSAMTQLREKLEAGLAQFPAQLSETFAPMPGHIERAEDGLGKKVNNVGEGLSKKFDFVGDGLQKRFDLVGESLARKFQEAVDMLGKRMEDAAKANRVQIVTAANPSRVDPTAAPPPPPPSAALPYDPNADTPSSFAEGPRETKTVLHSIDKLRALRGNP